LSDKKDLGLFWGAGALTIAGTLLATIGGFGAILSLIIGPDIRAYNRVSPFLAFFSFFVLTHPLSWTVEKIKRKLTHNNINNAIANGIVSAGLFSLFVLALVDQSYAVKPLLNRYSIDRLQTFEERHLVDNLERHHPQLTIFYQLPESPFPLDAGTQKMGVYDHGRPYIWSQHLKWSWPNFSRKGQTWLEKIGNPSEPKFFQNLADSGFNAVWLDRNGYDESSLELIQNQLHNILGRPLIVSEYGRYEVYSLETLMKSKKVLSPK
jgi:phosphoglycerol transferase